MPRPARAPRSPAASPPTTAAVAADGQTGDAGSISTRLSFLIHTISATVRGEQTSGLPKTVFLSN